MPLYEYQCKQCGHRFEKIQSFSAAEIKECPVCAGEVEKLISAPAFAFKGSGWYVSDYGKGGAAGSNTRPDNKPKADGSSSSSEGSSNSSGEAKPAASSDSGSTSSSSGTGSASAAPAASPNTSSSKKD